MPTYPLGYREPAYVSIARKYKPQKKKRFLALRRFGWKRMSKKPPSFKNTFFKKFQKKLYA